MEKFILFVSGFAMHKFLDVPTVGSETGESETKAVYDLLELWKLTKKMQTIGFGTRSVVSMGS